ncbi:hypothetical protein [Bacillus sp. FSL K6-6540]|uniref:hypothetical protein n=1 Tax=Bacillus sp. FSL K6-6540 TaxID=2921512 RepID=UPI0030FBCE8A
MQTTGKNQIKKLEDWKGSLDEFLSINDLVDEQIADHFIEVVPPAFFSAGIRQLGEAYSHVNGKPTYATLRRTEEGWRYCGHCFIGQTIEPSAFTSEELMKQINEAPFFEDIEVQDECLDKDWLCFKGGTWKYDVLNYIEYLKSEGR